MTKIVEEWSFTQQEKIYDFYFALERDDVLGNLRMFDRYAWI